MTYALQNKIPVDTVVEVFTGGCGSLISRGCNTNGWCGYQSRAFASVTTKGVYHIRVGSYGSGPTGTFYLRASTVTPPINNDCASALVIFDGLNGRFTNDVSQER